MKYGSKVVNGGLAIAVVVLLGLLLQMYEQGAFLKSGEQTIRGRFTGYEPDNAQPGCTGCVNNPDAIFKTKYGITIDVYTSAINLDLGPGSNPEITSFLKKAIVGFSNEKLTGNAEIHGYVDADSKEIRVTKGGDYIHAL